VYELTLFLSRQLQQRLQEAQAVCSSDHNDTAAAAVASHRRVQEAVASPLFTLSVDMMNSSDHVLDSDGELSDITATATTATADNTTAKADSSNQAQSKGSKKKRKLQSKGSSSSNSSAKVLKTSTASPTLNSSNSKSSGNKAASQEVKALQSALHDAKRSLGVKEKKVSVVL
jgi:hypothetical protein